VIRCNKRQIITPSVYQLLVEYSTKGCGKVMQFFNRTWVWFFVNFSGASIFFEEPMNEYIFFWVFIFWGVIWIWRS